MEGLAGRLNPAVTDEVEAEVQVLQDPLARVNSNTVKSDLYG
jgi:hypothetical protein